MRYPILNVLSFLLMITMNALANLLPINNKTTGELSNQYPNLFVPAGITFSIWGVIYSLLLVVMAIQFISKYREQINRHFWTITLNFCLNALWIIAWHYEQVGLSLVIMIALLSTLVVINKKFTPSAGWFLPFTFGIYLGWICLATIANITALLVSLSWGGFGIHESVWAITMIGAGTVIGCLVMYLLTNPFLALALVWGFYGIVLKREVDYPAIATASYMAMAATIITSVFVFFKSYSGKKLMSI